MALSINITACPKNACKTLSISELTGAYNVALNPGGYGTPNLAISDIELVILKITKPDGTTTTITNPIGLPTSDDSFEYEIPASTLDLNWTKIQDGRYTIVYEVYDTPISTPITVIRYFVFTCNLECCVARLFAKIATDNDCSCNSTTIKNALYAESLLLALQASTNCGNDTAITNLLNKLTKICTASSSGGGCS